MGSIASRVLSRLGIVVARHDSTSTLTIHLATNEVEQATDLDLILDGDTEGGLSFPLVLQSELYGPVFEEQLQGSSARVAETTADALTNALTTDGESLDRHRRGSALIGPDDPRREFKRQELADLDLLVSACRSWLAGEASSIEILDPELLLPPPEGTPVEQALDQFLELLDVIEEMPDDTLHLPSEMIALLGEAGLIDEIVRWRQDFGLDAARVLSRFTVSESPLQLLDPDQSTEPLAPNRRADSALKPLLQSQAEGGQPTVDIRTTRRCWTLDNNVAVITHASGSRCRARFMKAA
jgi:hypothetical protein